MMEPNRGETMRPRQLDAWVAAVAAVLIGTHLALPGPFTVTLAVPLALLPVWLPFLARQRGRGLVAVAGIGAIINGLLLNGLNASTHRISTSLTQAQVVLVLELLLGAGALVWARSVLGSARMALLFGCGVLVSVTLRMSPDNPWKFSLSLPVTICILALCWWRRAPRLELAAMAALALVSALNDSRSASSIMATALLILAWQRLRGAMRLRSSALRVVVNLVVLGLTTYFAMQAFILEGYLGERAQMRSEAQIRLTGSLLLGGRPEIGATLALLQAAPGGYGIGVIANFSDIYVAKSGMARLNYDPNNGYVERYMFGGGFEMHSVAGDLWIRFGLMGLVFMLAMLWLVLSNTAGRLAAGRGKALTTVLAIQVVWDACFSPFYTTAQLTMMLALALLNPLNGDDEKEPRRALP